MMEHTIEEFENKIICGDALEVMRKIPTESIGLILTSPPYNLKNSSGNGMQHDSGNKGRWGNSSLKDGYDQHDDNMPHDLYVKWQIECLSEMYRLLKEDGAIFYVHKWRVQNGILQDRQDIVGGFPVRQIIIWQRSGGLNFNDSFFLPTYEVIYLIAKPKFYLKQGSNALTDIWKIRQETNSKHPAPFPLGLAENVVRSVQTDLILDPFSGSGTTALAAKKNGMKYIGIDNSPKYCEMAEKRLKMYGGILDHFKR